MKTEYICSAIALCLSAATACGASSHASESPQTVDPSEHRGGLECGDLRPATGPLGHICKASTKALATVEVTAAPIKASRWRVLSALLDASQFGALPRPMPPGFKAPPVPHSVRLAPTAGSPFLDHYRLFWGMLQAATLHVRVRGEAIEVVQLWRINGMWSERDIRDGYPNIGAAELKAKVGTPIMAPRLYTIVRFHLKAVGNETHVRMVQTGAPAFNKPIFAAHWQGLYFQPLAKFLSAP